MKLFFTLLFFLSSAFAEETIDILSHKNLKGLFIDIRGSYTLEGESGHQISSGYYGHAAYLFPVEEGIRWSKVYDEKKISIIPSSPETQILIDGIEHNGTVTIYLMNKSLHVVNTVSTETVVHNYLENLPEDTPEESLKAALLTIKTDLYALNRQKEKKIWSLEKEKYDLLGSLCIWPSSPYKALINKVSNMMLTYNNRPFKTNITKHCAGATARYCDIFHQKEPSPRGVVAPEAQESRVQTQWHFSIDRAAFTKAFSLPEITAIKNFVEPASGKSYALRCSTKTSSKGIPFARLQKVLGKQNLQSNDFNVRLGEQKITFIGYGVGSGTGLCLHTSSILAKKGHSFRSILQFFFPDTQFSKKVR